ncbi:MAG TPA: LacI family DNA-binding transcriptional regulator [Bacteroidales bacterium]|nr:LacI family DNA-binding transcriptional regulator [Bacteroidales bacterium]
MKSKRDVTIYDVAKVLNISASTVSRGLNDHPHLRKETVLKIKTTADEMGYQPNKFASNLRLRKTNTLGLVVPKLNSYFMAAVISGIEKITNENGYGLIISTSNESESREISSVNTLFKSRVDGLMVSVAYDTVSPQHFDIFLKKNIPVVFFDRVFKHAGCVSIVIDNVSAGYEATMHLVEQGCKRIAHIGGNMQRDVYSGRFEGYKKALNDSGIMFDKNLVSVGDMSQEAGFESAKKFLKMKNRPDGVFAANDTVAVALIMYLLDADIRVPEDICVVGFNNEPLSTIIKPNLSTVDYPACQIGETAATSLINKLNNKHTENIIIEHKLIVRDSSLRKK